MGRGADCTACVRATPHSVTGRQHGRFLTAIFNWVHRDVGRIFVQRFDASLGVWLDHRANQCVYAETCRDALAMEHNGDLFACDHFVVPRCRLGNLAETPLFALAISPQRREFGAGKQDFPRHCRTCSVAFACYGGSPNGRAVGLSV